MESGHVQRLAPRLLLVAAIAVAFSSVLKTLPRDQDILLDLGQGRADAASVSAVLTSDAEQVAGFERSFSGLAPSTVRYAPRVPNGDYVLTVSVTSRTHREPIQTEHRLQLAGDRVRVHVEPR